MRKRARGFERRIARAPSIDHPTKRRLEITRFRHAGKKRMIRPGALPFGDLEGRPGLDARREDDLLKEVGVDETEIERTMLFQAPVRKPRPSGL